MSFLRHREIFPSDGGASPAANAPAHRLDEFPAGYSSAGCSPAWPASASPTGHQYAVMLSCRSRSLHRTANLVLTVCVSRGGKRKRTHRQLRILHSQSCGGPSRQLDLHEASSVFAAVVCNATMLKVGTRLLVFHRLNASSAVLGALPIVGFGRLRGCVEGRADEVAVLSG
jgi:hypothetical protein